MIRIRMAALGLALAAGAASTAAAQSTTTPQTQSDRGERKARGEHRGRGERGERRGERRLFRDISLSETQQARVKEIRDSYRAQWQQLREANRPAMEQAMKDARAARQRGDTAAARAAFARTADARQQMTALRDKELAEIRATLTSDQQRQFDANLAQMKERMEKRAGKRGGRRA